MQAVCYSRIRYVGNGDFERTERQRRVLSEIYYKIKELDKTKLINLILELLPLIETSMEKQTILNLALDYLNIDNMTFEHERFPTDKYCWGDMSTGIYYLKFDYDATKQQIKDYIYNDNKPETLN